MARKQDCHNSMIRRIGRQAGFSLIEVMIVVTVVAVAALGLSSLVNNMVVTAATQKFIDSTNAFNDELHSILSDPNACLQTFSNPAVTLVGAATPGSGMAVHVTKIRDNAGNTLYSTTAPNNVYGDNVIGKGSGQIVDLFLDAYSDDPLTLNYGILRLDVAYSHVVNGQTSGGQNIYKTIFLQTQRSAAFQLISCVALGDMQNRVQNAALNSNNSITNSDWGTPVNSPNTYIHTAPGVASTGSLGIGTAPTVPLDVVDFVPNLGGGLLPATVFAWGLPEPYNIVNPHNTVGVLRSDGGGSIELGANSANGVNAFVGPLGQPGAPYIDFHYGSGNAEIFNMRFQNTQDNQLQVLYQGMGAISNNLAEFDSTPTNPYYLGVGGPAYNGNYVVNVNGTLNAGTALYVAGVQICSVAGGGCVGPSDIRLKKDIEPLSNSLDQVLKLRGVTYKWKHRVTADKAPQIGFIAQEVEKVYPQVVDTDKLSGLKSIAYEKLIAPVIEAIKAVNSKVTNLETKYALLAAESTTITTEMADLKVRLTALEQRTRKRERPVEETVDKGEK
jgi:prepilin-type N-terminal cleavage/methylation domain-containing protein